LPNALYHSEGFGYHPGFQKDPANRRLQHQGQYFFLNAKARLKPSTLLSGVCLATGSGLKADPTIAGRRL